MEYEQIKKIINDMSQSSLSSLNIEFPDGVKINITKDNNTIQNNVVQNQPVVKQENTDVKSSNIEAKEEVENVNIVTSPMVGTFYTKPAPDKEDFVKVGDKVKKGQVLCIIEAMKLMNEIESEYDGQIVEICQKNEDMVDYGRPLFKIK